MNNRFFEKSSQELTTKSRNCSITYERKKINIKKRRWQKSNSSRKLSGYWEFSIRWWLLWIGYSNPWESLVLPRLICSLCIPAHFEPLGCSSTHSKIEEHLSFIPFSVIPSRLSFVSCPAILSRYLFAPAPYSFP